LVKYSNEGGRRWETWLGTKQIHQTIRDPLEMI
jgi:hypothetical protein